jgi:hypothetical protein
MATKVAAEIADIKECGDKVDVLMANRAHVIQHQHVIHLRPKQGLVDPHKSVRMNAKMEIGG